MLFISGPEWALLLVLFVVAFGWICVISSGHRTSTSYWWVLLASLLNLLPFALVLIFYRLWTESNLALNP